MTSVTGNAYADSLLGTNASSATTTSTATKKAASSTIDQAGFLKLLTTQLQTQDPTAPTDNSQMVAQMAQMSQVQGITEMNQSLSAISSTLSAARFGDAASWIGRSALVSSSTASPLSNGVYAGEASLPASATDVTVSFADANGQVLKTLDLGAQSQGPVDFAWDGKDADGNAVASGKLKVSVTAVGSTGKLDTTTSTWTAIQSVQSPTTGTTKLFTDLGSFDPADVQELS